MQYLSLIIIVKAENLALTYENKESIIMSGINNNVDHKKTIGLIQPVFCQDPSERVR